MTHSHTVSLGPSSSSPWAVGDAARGELLEWFLDADFRSQDDHDFLVALTGTRRGPRRNVSRMRAAALFALEASEDVFSAHYMELRRSLLLAREYWQRAMNESDRALRQRHAELALRAVAEMRSEVTALDFARDADTNDVSWPAASSYPEPVRTATSLAGELAIAMYDEMLHARRAGLCKVCGRPWLSALRKDRQLCGRPECLTSWRNAHRKPEDPAKVYERVLRSRGVPEDEIKKRSRAQRAKRGAGRGKTRSR